LHTSSSTHPDDFWRYRLASDWLDLKLTLFCGETTMTPAEIAKLTEQAQRAKTLMAKASQSGAKAKNVNDSFEQTLARFDSNVDQVSKQDAALQAMMAAMGNAGPILDQAFQDDAPAAPVSAKPGENAHLAAVNGGKA
jgi:hypothetical protein